MQKLDEKTAFCLLCFLCCCIGAAFFCFVHIPAREDLCLLREEAALVSGEIVDIENFTNKHRDLKAYTEDIKKQLEKAKHALPDTVEQSSVVSLLQHHALIKGIQLTSITPGQTKREHDLLMLPIRVKINCNYFQLLDFLKALEEDDRFVKINQLCVHETDGRLSFEIETTVYAMDHAIDKDDRHF